jgi:hypothetical protein
MGLRFLAVAAARSYVASAAVEARQLTVALRIVSFIVRPGVPRGTIKARVQNEKG